MKVVDTTLLIGHARGEARVASYLTEHTAETLVVPTIAFQELAVGEVAARDESKAAIFGHLGAFDVHAFDVDHATTRRSSRRNCAPQASTILCWRWTFSSVALRACFRFPS